MAAGPGLLLALALGAGALDVEVGLVAGARSRSVQQGGADWQHTLELVTVPSVALVAERPDWRVSAGYAPRLTAPDVLTGDRVDAWQELLLDALLRATPTLRLEGMAVGAVGTSSLLSDSWRSAGPDPVRTADRVHHFAFRSRLASEARLGRGSTLTVTLGWSRGGGSDPSSRELLPVEEALQLDAWLLWRASRVDVLEVRLAMTDTTLDIGSRATMATLAGRWRRQVTESLAAWAAAGSGLVVSEGLSDTEPTRGTLLLEAGAEHALPVHGYLQRLEIRAAPGIDRLLGTVDPRLEGEYVGTFGRLPAWRLEGRIVAAMTRRTPGTDHLALLEVRLLRGLTRSLTVRGGVQGSRQRSTDPALPALVEWIALAGIEWWPTGRPESAYGPIGARPGGGPWW